MACENEMGHSVTVEVYDFFFAMAQQLLVGQGLLLI